MLYIRKCRGAKLISKMPILDIETGYTNMFDMAEECVNGFLNLQNNNFMDATLTALETGNLSQLAKEELKYTIQTRRLATGKEELKVDFPEPMKYKLTKEEELRIIKRREQNKLAAQRFRQRKKQSKQTLSQHIEVLESDNIIKMAELTRLRDEKEKLYRILQNHLLICPGLNTF